MEKNAGAVHVVLLANGMICNTTPANQIERFLKTRYGTTSTYLTKKALAEVELNVMSVG